MESQSYQPDESRELDRLLVVEHALGEGGIIDRHLKWVPVEDSPSHDITKKDYGYMPLRFSGVVEPSDTALRPAHEPINARTLFTSQLKLPHDTPEHVLAERVYSIDRGWFESLEGKTTQSGALFDEDKIKSMINAANRAYRLDTLTEDNLPAYVQTILGGFSALAKKHGVSIPALEEWSRGIWTSEEDGHKLSMNDYGQKVGILNTKEHAYGRNSQLRAGTEINFHHVIQLFVYTSWQELSTCYAHKNDGALFGPVGSNLLGSIGAQESRHHVAYFSVLKELMEYFPDDVVQTLYDTLASPTMPGSIGVPNFTSEGIKIHRSAIFGMEEAYNAARVVIRKLGLLDKDFDTQKLSDNGHQALQHLRELYGHEVVFRERKKADFVLGQTVTVAELRTYREEYERELGLAA